MLPLQDIVHLQDILPTELAECSFEGGTED